MYYFNVEEIYKNIQRFAGPKDIYYALPDYPKSLAFGVKYGSHIADAKTIQRDAIKKINIFPIDIIREFRLYSNIYAIQFYFGIRRNINIELYVFKSYDIDGGLSSWQHQNILISIELQTLIKHTDHLGLVSFVLDTNMVSLSTQSKNEFSPYMKNNLLLVYCKTEEILLTAQAFMSGRWRRKGKYQDTTGFVFSKKDQDNLLQKGLTLEKIIDDIKGSFSGELSENYFRPVQLNRIPKQV